MPYAIDAQHRLVLTGQAWDEIRSINQEGNTKIIFQEDSQTWNSIDRWEFPKEMNGKKYEDCDGYTLWKIDALMKAGFPPSCLLFTVTKDELGEGHAVLCVTTDHGDFICDNRQDDVKPWVDLQAAGYTFLWRTQIGGSLTGLWDQIGLYR